MHVILQMWFFDRRENPSYREWCQITHPDVKGAWKQKKVQNLLLVNDKLMSQMQSLLKLQITLQKTLLETTIKDEKF